MNTFKYLTKRTLSYFKSSWNFEDYPITTWKNPNAEEDKVKYGAKIIGWLIVGHGATRNEAIEALRESFKLYKENNKSLPRPGTKVPLQFASTEKTDMYEHIAVDFFEKVLEMDFYGGFYSDGTYLDLFNPEYSETDEKFKSHIIKKTFEHYDVDITDVYDKALWQVLEKIKSKT